MKFYCGRPAWLSAAQRDGRFNPWWSPRSKAPACATCPLSDSARALHAFGLPVAADAPPPVLAFLPPFDGAPGFGQPFCSVLGQGPMSTGSKRWLGGGERLLPMTGL